ncbi:MAG: MBL fold metallo-hydrolase [Chloroflexota bacterium]
MLHGSTHTRRVALALTAMLTAAVLLAPGLSMSSPATAQGGTVKLEWLGWSFFRLTSPSGKVVLINPYITGNADAAVSVDDINQADLILVADAHRDEIGDTVAIAQKTGAKVYGPSRVTRWLVEAQGLPAAQNVGGNQGDRYRGVEGITVRNVLSIHDNSFGAPTPTLTYGGISSGFYVTFENDWTVYFSGSSATSSDQALWAQMWKPDAIIFHMSGTHDPADVAMSIKLTASDNPNLQVAMPHHHRVSPNAGDTSIAEVDAALSSMRVSMPITNQVRSQVYEFTK